MRNATKSKSLKVSPIQKALIKKKGDLLKVLDPQVIEFAKQMQNELFANVRKHGNGWRNWRDVDAMLNELEYHKAKLIIALNPKKGKADYALVKELIADCANFLLFIGNAGNLYLDDATGSYAATVKRKVSKPVKRGPSPL